MIKNKIALSPNILFLILFGSWTVLNIFVAAFSELANDEAYYRFYAEQLGLGYFDHPPMIAILIKLGTLLFGGELGVRFIVVLLQPFYLWLLWDILKSAKPTTEEVGLYFLLTFSMPLLQLYGFIATPDAPLMFFSALFLWAYIKFLRTNKWLYVFVLSLSIAALAYSKYQGALVVAFVLLSHWRLFRNPKFYCAILGSIILILPHLVWQYQHNWVSFYYHLYDRAIDFRINAIIEYIVNLMLLFNPLLLPCFITALLKLGKSDMKRVYSFLVIGIVLFFAITLRSNRVQAQWLIPMTYGVIAILYTYIQHRSKMRHYVKVIGYICIPLFLLFRVAFVFNPFGLLKMEIFNNKTSFQQIYDEVGDLPVIFGGYANASKYKFYTGQTGFAHPEIYYRSSHYEFSDIDDDFTGKKVVIETNNTTNPPLKLHNGKTFSYRIAEPFMPLRKIKIETTPIPKILHPSDTLQIQLTISNPYPFDYRVGKNENCSIVFALRRWGVHVELLDTEVEKVIEAKSTTTCSVQVVIPPNIVLRDNYCAGFLIYSNNQPSWFNSSPKLVSVRL